MSLLRAAAFVAVPGLRFTWRTNLPVPCNKWAGSGSAAPLKNPTFTCEVNVPAFSHHLKPLMRDGSQFTCMLFHPRSGGGIPLDSAVESQRSCGYRKLRPG
jgi:hypothetical protein